MTGAQTPRLSVVVPVYNGAKTLDSCLRSVQHAVAMLSQQQRRQVEVVACDNHSTDETLSIARDVRYECQSRVIQPPRHLPNRTENWHHALGSADGDWLLMLHADDALMPQALVAWFEATASPLADDVGFITARHRNFDRSLLDLSPPHPRFFPSPALLRGRDMVRWVLPLMCPFLPFVLVRRAAYHDVGGLDSRLELTQDWDLWIRLCRRYDVLYVPYVVGAFRVHPTSPTYQRVNMDEHITVLQELEDNRATPMPRPIPWLARRTLRARVAHVLELDETDAAKRIRERAGAPPSGRPSRAASWLRASGVLVSVTLYGMRAVGALRAIALSRRRRLASADLGRL